MRRITEIETLMKITIHLTEEQGEKLAYIQQHTAQDITSLLDLAINQQYEKLRPSPANPIAIWQESGFIGCGQGESDLSTNYKAILQESWSDKYDNR
jgi:hypothetical protein